MGKMHRKEKNIPIRPMAWPEAGHKQRIAETDRDYGKTLGQRFRYYAARNNHITFDLDPVCRLAAHLRHRKWNAKTLYVQTFHENVNVASSLDKGNEVGVVLKQPHQRNQVEHSDLVSLEWETISGPGTCFPCFEVHGGRWCHCHRLEHEVIHRWWKTIPAYDERTGTVCSCSAPDKSNTDINASNWKLVFVSDGR